MGMGRRGFGASPSNASEHIISVSELQAGGAATWRGAVAGYHIESWSDPERAYVAISDIDASELADFARAFRAAEPPPP
jgi:anti-sigma factor RsiW